MILSKVRTGTARFLNGAVKSRVRFQATSVATGKWNGGVRFLSTESEKEFQESGILDENGLTVFDTLHEMQTRACKVYAKNDLFGTYQEESKIFEYMTYEEYDEKVNQCRATLKTLGKLEFQTTVHKLVLAFRFILTSSLNFLNFCYKRRGRIQ